MPETREPEPLDLTAAAEPYLHVRAHRREPIPAEIDRAIAADRPLAEAARRARRRLVPEALARVGDAVPTELVVAYASALLAVPRERFVVPEEIAASADDFPSPLDAVGLATVSAPHAYLLSYGLVGLTAGDHLLELGSGTGYGAALASHIVGPGGLVTSIEIDPALHARAVRLLAEPGARGPAPVVLLEGNARTLAPSMMSSGGPRPLRVVITYAVPSDPEALLDLLPEGGRLIAPVGADELGQDLVRWERRAGALIPSAHGGVRYVAER